MNTNKTPCPIYVVKRRPLSLLKISIMVCKQLKDQRLHRLLPSVDNDDQRRSDYCVVWLCLATLECSSSSTRNLRRNSRRSPKLLRYFCRFEDLWFDSPHSGLHQVWSRSDSCSPSIVFIMVLAKSAWMYLCLWKSLSQIIKVRHGLVCDIEYYQVW